MAKINFTLNGKPATIEDLPEDMPVLWYLRDISGLTGAKFGCGKGFCGACTVHLNGKAVRSCSTPITALEGAAVTTIEGLSENGDHPVQKAWIEVNVPQCGYCQAGQIMNAAALLNENRNPSDAEILAAMEGNLCRCGTYNRIKNAIQLAAQNIES